MDVHKERERQREERKRKIEETKTTNAKYERYRNQLQRPIVHRRKININEYHARVRPSTSNNNHISQPSQSNQSKLVHPPERNFEHKINQGSSKRKETISKEDADVINLVSNINNPPPATTVVPYIAPPELDNEDSFDDFDLNEYNDQTYGHLPAIIQAADTRREAERQEALQPSNPNSNPISSVIQRLTSDIRQETTNSSNPEEQVRTSTLNMVDSAPREEQPSSSQSDQQDVVVIEDPPISLGEFLERSRHSEQRTRERDHILEVIRQRLVSERRQPTNVSISSQATQPASNIPTITIPSTPPSETTPTILPLTATQSSSSIPSTSKSNASQQPNYKEKPTIKIQNIIHQKNGDTINIFKAFIEKQKLPNFVGIYMPGKVHRKRMAYIHFASAIGLTKIVEQLDGMEFEGSPLKAVIDNNTIKMIEKELIANQQEKEELRPVHESMRRFMTTGNREAKCPICLNLYLEKEALGAINGCGHVICSECLQRYKDSSKVSNALCPVCRQPPPYGTAISTLRFL